MNKIFMLFVTLWVQTLQGMEKLPHELQSLLDDACGRGNAVAMFDLGKLHADKKDDFKVTIGWLLAFGARSIQDASILEAGGLKRINDMKNIVGQLAAENEQLNNFYIDKQSQYEDEFNLRVNQILILTEQDKLEDPAWMGAFLGNKESDKFIDQAEWKQKRLDALRNAPQLLLPGFKHEN